MTANMGYGQESSALLVAAVGLALLTILSVWKLKKFKYKLVHETGGAMFYGMLVGLMLRFLSSDSGGQTVNTATVCRCTGFNNTPHVLKINFTSQAEERCLSISTSHTETPDPEVLFNLFLPAIIFHGAYTLNQKRFADNIGSILTFAFLGTIISCAIIGSCVYGFTRLMVLLGRAADGDFFLSDCLLFGAIMSATDPVSVLGLLSELRMDVDLHTLLFGESVLNDAVAIVLTHAITSYSQMDTGHDFSPPALLLSIGHFLGVLAGSLILGFMLAVITALLTKFTRLCENPLLETSVFFLLSWFSFLLAEAGGLSGILAVLCCGLSQARYTVHNLSPEGRGRTKQLFEVFSFLGEIFIFSYIGCVLLTFPQHAFKALFISGAFLSIFISRACSVYPLSFLLNLRRTTKIPAAFQHFMMLSGLRGAVAFRMAARDTTTEMRRAMFSTTLLLVGFTVWVLGAAADPMLHCLNIKHGDAAEESPDHLSFEVAAAQPDTTRGLWHRLDYKYLQPLLTHHGPPLTDSLPPCCGCLVRIFSSPHLQKDEEQLCEKDPGDPTCEFEEPEHQLVPVGVDSASEHQEDLLEGDLGLGTAAALSREV